MLRPGYVQRAWRLLEILQTYEPATGEMRRHLSRIEGIDLDHLLPLLLDCEYVMSPANPALTPKGLAAWQLGESEAFVRQLLRDYMHSVAPNWAGLARQGRGSFLSYASGELRQCFSEAGLLRDDTNAAEWWDALFLENKGELAWENLMLGRQGESKSIRYEKKRLDIEPEWVSLHRPTSPYDLLSFSSPDRSERLVIEVKSSRESLTTAVFFISANEWKFLSSSRCAVVHLWPEVERDGEEPLVVPIGALTDHIPSNNGSGTWDVAVVPFAAALMSCSQP